MLSLRMADVELTQRIDRLELREAIRNLVARYAVLIDARDDALTVSSSTMSAFPVTSGDARR